MLFEGKQLKCNLNSAIMANLNVKTLATFKLNFVTANQGLKTLLIIKWVYLTVLLGRI